MTCQFCLERDSRGLNRMCDPCGKSYDRSAHREGSVLEAMLWAARRAIRFERRRARQARRP